MAGRRAGSSGWARRYPPLSAIVFALVLAVFALPSALNLPQANPGQTLEYAPVPPDKNGQPPPGGNLAALGAGSSSTLGEVGPGSGGGEGGSLPTVPPPLPPGLGARPSSKQCVGNPPRQTEDPLSPPCVAFFQGDNGGATYGGVARNEIRIVYYIQSQVNSDQDSTFHAGQVYDLAKSYATEPDTNKYLRALMFYFNNRFQTYGRFVHFYAHIAPHNPPTSAEARQDAADDYANIHPFASLTYNNNGGTDPYTQGLVGNGVLGFGSVQDRSQSFYQRYAGLDWGYLPPLEYQATEFATLLCKQVFGRPVSFSANGDIGHPRKVGLLYPDSPDFPGMLAFSELVEQEVGQCGGSFAVKHSFSSIGTTNPANGSSDNATATQNQADFKQQGITTIVWTQGYNSKETPAAARLNYHPEWVVAGDGSID
ncbi:MAG: hypothetical protein ACYDGR_16165, partial [Candidatus Dormibacteria bacterium]